MDDIRSRIGMRVKQLRKQKRITQEELALRTGLDRTYINSIENGRRNVSIENIEKISHSLGQSLKGFFDSELFCGRPDSNDIGHRKE